MSFRILRTTALLLTVVSLSACQLFRNNNEANYLGKLSHADGVQVIKVADTLRFILDSDVFFKSTTPQLQTSKYATLNLIADELKQYQHTPIKVIGNADNIGIDKNIEKRSMQRANNIAAYLWNRGVSQYNLEVSTNAQFDPVSQNTTNKGRADNRRIEIRVKNL